MNTQKQYQIQFGLTLLGALVLIVVFIVGQEKRVIPSPDTKLRDLFRLSPPSRTEAQAESAHKAEGISQPNTRTAQPSEPTRGELEPPTPLRVTAIPMEASLADMPVPGTTTARPRPSQEHLESIHAEQIQVTKMNLETTDSQSPASEAVQASPRTNRLDRVSTTKNNFQSNGETNQIPTVTLSMANFQRAAMLVEHGVTAPRMRARYSTGDILRLVQTGAGYLVAESHDDGNTNKMLLKGTLSNPSFIRLSGERAHSMANVGIDLVTEGPLVPAAEWVSNYFGNGRTKLVFYPSSNLGRSMVQKQLSAILAANIKRDEVACTDGEIVMMGSSAIYVLSEIALKNGRTISVSDPESGTRTTMRMN